ncbi:helix-turn-helix domain-containing protein [Pseudomonas sp. BBP2017]|uniref:helix-turn-helix domain-containing protein n=1 Tax=Pseudomonas sp. BBP2017 TaxID=2109731 RepID=UPI0011B28B7E|nr:helix-turn-helix domain-containing protein [Pseudomonas sp. BBP2017]
MKSSDMENSSSMSDAQTPPDYHRCLPVELHSQADAFIHYLHELPNRSPVKCPECDHPRFRLDTQPNLRLPFYRCVACNKGFNCLTKHPFSNYGHMHLWSTYGHYLLAGWPTPAIAKAMGISPSTTWRWIKPCRAVMAKEFPALYHWWSARQDRTSLEPPAHIAAQAQAFLGRLEHLLTTRQAVCPKCGSPDMQRIDQRRPNFRCPGCWTKVSLIKGTLLCRLGYPEHWLGFAQGLINGESIVDLQRRTGLCGAACKRWQVRFMQIIEQQGHAELARWITWLRSRRVKEVSDFVRDGGQLEVVSGSRYSAGSKRASKIPPNRHRK